METRGVERLARAQLWLALLTLVQRRSPFLPWIYGVVSTLWLLLLLLPAAKGWRLGLIVGAWLILSFNLRTQPTGFNFSYTLVSSLLIFGAIAAGLGFHAGLLNRGRWRKRRGQPAAFPSAP